MDLCFYWLNVSHLTRTTVKMCQYIRYWYLATLLHGILLIAHSSGVTIVCVFLVCVSQSKIGNEMNLTIIYLILSISNIFSWLLAVGKFYYLVDCLHLLGHSFNLLPPGLFFFKYAFYGYK